MRGKYITTSVKLAVLSGSRKQQRPAVEEATASLSNHEIIWSKQRKSTTSGHTKKATPAFYEMMETMC